MLIPITHRETFELTDENGKVWRFEYDYLGVDVISRKTDKPYKRPPREKSPFWPAFNKWLNDYRNGKIWGRLE